MLLLLATAQAATVTELPPFLRGDLGVSYTLDRLQGSLVERAPLPSDDEVVGQRQDNAHVLHYTLAFGVAPGAAVYVDVPHTVYRAIELQDWSSMVYDPATESGSYHGTGTEEDATLTKGGGLDGVWIGAKGTPYSEAFPKRNNRFTLMLEGAVRTPGTGSWFVVNEPSTTGGLGMHGAGTGGVGLMIGVVASARHGKHEPYVALSYVDNLPTEVDILADDGTVIDNGVEIDPANSVTGRVGAEFITSENAASGARSAIDLHLTAEWTSSEDVPTGLNLPGVLLPEAGLVQKAESFEIGGGAGVDIQFMKFLSWQLGAEARYHLPQRWEHPYPAYAGGDSLHILARTGFTISLR